MTAEHFDVIVRLLLERKPFRIFSLELQRGERFEIDHPEALVLIEEVALFVSPGGFRIWFDHENVNRIIEAPMHAIEAE